MARNKIPIDGEPSGLLAIPISEIGSLRFLFFLRQFYDALGRSGGDRIVWRTIDNPRKTDQAYEKMRTSSQAHSDEYSVNKYDFLIESRGGEDHHIARENNLLADKFGVGASDRPCILFSTSPEVGPKPILRIPRALLGSSESMLQLGEFLLGRLSDELIETFLQDGFLTDESMHRFNFEIKSMEDELGALAGNTPRDATSRPQNAYVQMVYSDGMKFLDKQDFEKALARRKPYHLIINVLDGWALCKNGKKFHQVTIRNRGIRILAEIILADRKIEVAKTRTGALCASRRAANNTFYEGRKLVIDRLKGAPTLFKPAKGLSPDISYYSFDPPKNFKWVVFYPVE